MRAVLITLLLVSGLGVHALPLEPIAAPVDAPPAVDPNAPDLTCDQVMPALLNYQSMTNQNNAALAAYLGQIGAKLTEWYGQLKGLEGQNQTLPVGSFSVLKDGASKVNSLNSTVGDNASLLAQELARIQTSLAKCQILAK